ncbi:MAG: cobalamin B12-binding domain-containing protein [Chloroflexi bacterium]|nr:cobalamin B12-binding domain-containing protein [Chloroflexota bacterium]
MPHRKPKVLLARFELDGHDRGILVIMNALRNAGMEVIYIHFSDPKEIVKSALEEDVDLIGVASSIGQHLAVSRDLLDGLRTNNTDIPVIVGGVVPATDIPRLAEMGIRRVFGPGTRPQDVVAFVSQTARQGP